MPLHLAFATRSLRRLCENEATAQRELGIALAKKLKARLADFLAAENVSQIIVGRSQALDNARSPEMVVILGPTARLRIRANHRKIPRTDAGGVDWSLITRIQIRRIERDDA